MSKLEVKPVTQVFPPTNSERTTRSGFAIVSLVTGEAPEYWTSDDKKNAWTTNILFADIFDREEMARARMKMV
jgi:hypothetical protein